LHNGVVGENNGLKAQVELAHEALTMISEQVKHGFVICSACGHQDSTEHHDTLWMAESALNKTPRQCLASLNADAEKKGYWRGFETGSICPSTNILMHYNGWLELKAENERHENKLREESK